MPLALSIQPFSHVLDMYGDADLSSTFSLSGHVSVSLTSNASLLFERKKTTTHIVLQSLVITFDGHSEMISPGTGYTPIRLCSVSRELIPDGPVELSNEGYEDSEGPCLWNIIFDIPVPGWLPTTATYGDASLQDAGTSYALYATAIFVDSGHEHSLFSFTKICRPVRPRTRTTDAPRHPITLRRFVEPRPGAAFPMSDYIVDARREPDSDGSSRKSIPYDVLEKIQVIASVPSAVAVEEASFPFVLRIRGKDLEDSARSQLRIKEFFVDTEQIEVYRKNSSPDDDRYPIPAQSHQPPRTPLRNPHPIHTLYDSGFLEACGSSMKRAFSILAPTESGRYIISGDGHIFASDHGASPHDSNWYMLETKVPISTLPYLRDWAGPQKRRITESSPLFSVEHFMHVVIHCEYEWAESGEVSLERLHFSLPMKHVNVPKVSMPSTNDMEDRCPDAPKNLPCTQSLPAYSQLFHSNDEQELDFFVPLPLYEPPFFSPSESSLSNRQTRT